MKLDPEYIESINYWENVVVTLDNVVTDLIKLDFGSNHIELIFKFPRFKNLCYNENFRDYSIVFTKDTELMQ